MLNVKCDYLSSEFLFIMEEFCQTLKASRTKAEYIGYIRILCNKFVKKDYLEITEADAVEAFRRMNTYIKEGRLSKKTVCTRLGCYKSISKFICNNYPELSYKDPFRFIERPFIDDRISSATIPSIEELDKILTIAKENPTYYLIIVLSTRVGLSSSKIIEIQMDSFYMHNGRLGVYLPNKENEHKTLSVILPTDVASLVEEYLKFQRSMGIEGYLFRNSRGNQMTLKNLSTHIHSIVKKAGIENNYTLQDMRARAIMDMISAGVDEKTIQEYIGIGAMRTRQYFEAKGCLYGCPADMVNYQLKQRSIG